MSADLLWAQPPANVVATNDEIHVWRASLDLPDPYVCQFRQTLADDEQQRADRFHFEKDRKAFVVARGLLRTILGRYLNMAPDAVRFSYNRYGKPAVEQAVCFNLSHSAALAIYAVARGRDVGVDVECIRRLPDAQRIAERYFSERERTELRALPVDQRQEAFFRCWTRKEAYIKATGQGLSLPLDQFDVSLSPGEPATISHPRQDPEENASWSLRELDPGPGYAAALAVEGHDWQLRAWQWTATPTPQEETSR